MSGAVPPGAALRRFDALIALLDDFPEDSDAVLAGRSAEREADLRAVAEAAVAAGGEGLLSPHGAALDARPLRPWRFATAALDAEAWAADGFCVLSGVLDAAALAEARAAAEAIIEAAFASSGMASRAAWQARVTQLPDPAVWEPRLGALERSPALRAAAAAGCARGALCLGAPRLQAPRRGPAPALAHRSADLAAAGGGGGSGGLDQPRSAPGHQRRAALCPGQPPRRRGPRRSGGPAGERRGRHPPPRRCPARQRSQPQRGLAACLDRGLCGGRGGAYPAPSSRSAAVTSRSVTLRMPTSRPPPITGSAPMRRLARMRQASVMSVSS